MATPPRVPLTSPAQRSSSLTEMSNGSARTPIRLVHRPGAVFFVSLIVRVILASVFLGSADSMNALTAIPLAATRTFFFLPYFPIVQNILVRPRRS